MSAIPKPAHTIERLLPRHFKILELVLQGFQLKEISETLCVSVGALTYITKSPMFVAELNRRRNAALTPAETNGSMILEAARAKANIVLANSAERAAQVHAELLEHAEDQSLQLRAADRILDRVFGAGTPSGPSISLSISAENVAILNLALQESNRERNIPNRTATNTTQDRHLDVCENVLGSTRTEG